MEEESQQKQQDENSYEENTYLLKISCNTQQLSKILRVDEDILERLYTEQQLCVPINKIKELSHQYSTKIKKNINQIHGDIQHGKQQFENESEDINEYLKEIEKKDVSDKDKNEYNNEIYEIFTSHKKRYEKVKQNFNAEELQKLNVSLRENLESINFFNENIKAEKKKVEEELEKLAIDLKKFAEENNAIQKEDEHLIKKNNNLKQTQSQQKKKIAQINNLERENRQKQHDSMKHKQVIKNDAINTERINNKNNIKLQQINNELQNISEKKNELEDDYLEKTVQLNSELKSAQREMEKQQNLEQQESMLKERIKQSGNIFTAIFGLNQEQKLDQQRLEQIKDQQLEINYSAKCNYESVKLKYDKHKERYNEKIEDLEQKEEKLKNQRKEIELYEDDLKTRNEFEEKLIEVENQIQEYQINIQQTKDEMKNTDEQINGYLEEIKYIQQQITLKRLNYNSRYEKNINRTNELKRLQDALPKLIAPKLFLANLAEALMQLEFVYDSYSLVETSLKNVTDRIQDNFQKYQKQNDKDDKKQVQNFSMIYRNSVKGLDKALNEGYSDLYMKSSDLQKKTILSNEKIQQNQMRYYSIANK